MDLDFNSTIMVAGVIIILCVIGLIVSPLIFKSDIDPEQAQEDLMEHRAEKYGQYLINTKGIHDDYYTIYTL